ncbi:hypothetical protein COV18_02700 [Candidatus Woesearchaeota archaeon CG10_big_fil_rev_8_21_14_0_10_37_12]|nr:MAG: hypothetical protein COV18_02700 [Candidatus Woesearchaeota archaeon CG10_big_fil_rev_8_21_14_0_10_37_12]
MSCPKHGLWCDGWCPAEHIEKMKIAEDRRKLTLYDLNASGASVHIHSDKSGNAVSGGTVKAIGSDEILHKLNGYEAALVDYHAKQLGLQGKDRTSK